MQYVDTAALTADMALYREAKAKGGERAGAGAGSSETARALAQLTYADRDWVSKFGVQWQERVAAVLPFFWYTEAGSVGLETLPLCRAAWEGIGKKILRAQQHHPNASAAVRLAGAARQCPGVAAGTPPPSKALIRPGHRNWCANTNP